MVVSAEEGVSPDFLCLAKGLTAGYLPACGHAGPRGDLRGVSRFLRERAGVLSRPHLHRLPAGGGGRAGKHPQAAPADRGRDPATSGLLFRPAARLRPSPGIPACGDPPARAWPRRSTSGREGTRTGRIRITRLGLRVCLRARDHGLLLRPLGRFAPLVPPLCLDEAELAELVGARRPRSTTRLRRLNVSGPPLSPISHVPTNLEPIREIYSLPLPELMLPRAGGAPAPPRPGRRAAVHAAVDQDRPLPGGLQVLPASAPLRDGPRAEPLMEPRRRRRGAGRAARAARPASAWGRPGAKCATARSSIRCSRRCAALPRSASRCAARWAC